MAAPPKKYDPSVIEPKWQAHWDAHGCFRAQRRPGRKKLYVLDMFPYPSGSGLHVGHPEGYTATDIVARYRRMCGYDVLHPMGWDAFGLPAEQHAIATGTHPRETTRTNIATFKRQLKALGFSYDWDREVDTTDIGYVKFTQWIFLRLFERGLAYQAEIPVNWCPALGTVLANEEVIDGKSERGGHPVERVPLRQWMFRITAYADRLEADLAGLDWPETKGKQVHWIGRSEGATVDFSVVGRSDTIRVFTTRVDTLPGVTYVVLAPEHPLVDLLTDAEHRAEVERYVESARSKSDQDRTDASREKTGVFTGAFAENPLTGDRVPIWVGDYVLGAYGTGAVMAVPAHDERDHAFARKFGLPTVTVVAPAQTPHSAPDVTERAFTDDGVAFGIIRARLPVEDGTPSAAVRSRITEWLVSEGRGAAKVTYRLRDWVFSRQRYWGEPIPIYFPVDCDGDPRAPGARYTIHYDKPIAVDDADLPVRLPDLDDFKPGNDPAGPLARVPQWRFFQKGEGSDARWYARETNTMPQWAGSCWYYLRFLDPTNSERPFSEKAYDDWMPVDLYVGGSEHAVLHLLYARFWHKALYDMGIVKHGEPFVKLVHQGMILGENGEKMSKSRGNVINPDDVVKSHGADALRVYEMFMGPLEQVKPWQTSGIEGVRRFLDRVYALSQLPSSAGPLEGETARAVHKTIKKVTEDIEAMRFNTAVSAMMILVKQLLTLPEVPREALSVIARLLNPFAPHLAEEVWQGIGETSLLTFAPWPTFDPALVVDDVVEIGVQVNGKVRSAVALSREAGEAEAKAAALADDKVQLHIAGKPIRKVVYVPGKILNFIV